MHREHGKLRPFRYTLKEAYAFFRKHWKDIIYIFLPVEILLLVILMWDRLYADSAPVVGVALAAIFIGLLRTVRNMICYAGGLVCESVADDAYHHDPFLWYKRSLSLIPSILWMMVLSIALLSASVIFAGALSFAVFILPFLVLGLLSRLNPTLMSYMSLDGGGVSAFIGVIAALLFLFSIVWTMLGLWSATYSYSVEGRRGLQALASGFMRADGRRLAIFWRLLLLAAISLLPFIIIVGPVLVVIVLGALKQIAYSMVLFGSLPAMPSVPLHLSVLRIALGFIASLIVLPISVIGSYFLWKEVRLAAAEFTEASYKRTMKYISFAVKSGAVVVAVSLVLAVGSAMLAPKAADTGALPDFGKIPASGMMH